MKAYVVAMVEIPIGDSRLFGRPDILVQFQSIPPADWPMSRLEAWRVCNDLNAAQVRSTKWPWHHCRFEVEEVARDAFAVFCNHHPLFDTPETDEATPHLDTAPLL